MGYSLSLKILNIILVVFRVIPAAAGCSTGAILTARAQDGPRIVVLGDSLVAGYELPPDAAYPAQLAAALKGKAWRP